MPTYVAAMQSLACVRMLTVSRSRRMMGALRTSTRFLIGCDGTPQHSAQARRRRIPRSEPTSLLRLGDVRMTLDGTRQRLPFGVVPLGDGNFRVITRERYPPGFDRDAPMTLEELQASVRPVFGIDLPMCEPRWLSRVTDAKRQAERYRAGSVFVAGDAAHIHLPAGGPGLSTGLQDAVNLGWKLAAEVRGWAPAGLLDTYHSERHPVGRRVLMHTRAQSALMNPGGHTAALREVLGELLEDDVALRRIVDLVQGTDVRYEMDGSAPTGTHWFDAL